MKLSLPSKLMIFLVSLPPPLLMLMYFLNFKKKSHLVYDQTQDSGAVFQDNSIVSKSSP